MAELTTLVYLNVCPSAVYGPQDDTTYPRYKYPDVSLKADMVQLTTLTALTELDLEGDVKQSFKCWVSPARWNKSNLAPHVAL
jgi:hypothetical protein